jgi:uncharacterized protein (DUF697 family)
MDKKRLMNKKKDTTSIKWLALINIPIQMGVIIFVFSFMGNWLDENQPSSIVYYNKIFVMVGVGLALYNVIRQVNKINKSK